MTTKSIESICHTLAAHSESREAVVAGRSFVPLLPLLEHPFAQVQSAIPVALAAVGFSHKEIENTSTERIAIFALTKANLGTYWGELAISWLEQGLQMNEILQWRLRQSHKTTAFAKPIGTEPLL
jgi:hypothetical protein